MKILSIFWFEKGIIYQGAPIFCGEPDETNQEKLVLVGVANRNTLYSNDQREPSVFARIFEQRWWIESKMSTWSNWTPCDHTCWQKRARYCDSDFEFGCQNDIMTEIQVCPNDQKIIYEDVALDWLPYVEEKVI